MPDATWYDREAQRTLTRLLPRLQADLDALDDTPAFLERLNAHFPAAFRLLHQIYGDHYDLIYHVEAILRTLITYTQQRPAHLRDLDRQREANPTWYQSEQMVGAVLYVDLFAGDFKGLHERIPYLKELGITYLHLMPVFLAPQDNSDGGYAVSDYRQTNPALGSIDELTDLIAALHAEGIAVVLDFVFNHTSDEHPWAVKARDGDPHYREFYHIFPDRSLPDQYEQHLREIFPEQAPGSFTYLSDMDAWVWTTFNTFQWDLNYGNPAVFDAMLGEMLFLANRGVDVLRLDAVAFIWKQMGTTCENLPQAHWIIQALNALVKVVAPALLFKSEAIVHPDEVARYVGVEECPLSYNPTFMALLWEALATREVRLLHHAMANRFALPDGAAWVNYVRVHDDIGWSFADEDAAALSMSGYDHRQFLNSFYSGRFPGSFARGLGFNFNPQNQDMRIAGTLASLAGLEYALADGDSRDRDHAIRRILLLHSLMIAAGGIPLLYIGDEIATVNDYSFRSDPAKANDERWVHRPTFDWERAERRNDPATYISRVFRGIKQMIDLRKTLPVFSADYQTLFFGTQNPHVLAFLRGHDVVVLANFSERPQTLRTDVLAAYWPVPDPLRDLLTGRLVDCTGGLISLDAYQTLWIVDGKRA